MDFADTSQPNPKCGQSCSSESYASVSANSCSTLVLLRAAVCILGKNQLVTTITTRAADILVACGRQNTTQCDAAAAGIVSHRGCCRHSPILTNRANLGL